MWASSDEAGGGGGGGAGACVVDATEGTESAHSSKKRKSTPIKTLRYDPAQDDDQEGDADDGN